MRNIYEQGEMVTVACQAPKRQTDLEIVGRVHVVDAKQLMKEKGDVINVVHFTHMANGIYTLSYSAPFIKGVYVIDIEMIDSDTKKIVGTNMYKFEVRGTKECLA